MQIKLLYVIEGKYCHNHMLFYWCCHCYINPKGHNLNLVV